MKLLMFGGTTEGRLLAQAYAKTDKCDVESMHICVATQYGNMLLPHDPRIIIHEGRMDRDDICRLLRDEGFDACIDATHPYADEVSKNIKSACDEQSVDLYRVLRDMSDKKDTISDADDILFFPDIDFAIDHLKSVTGNILITTGSKELEKYTCLKDYKDRCFVRVLPLSGVVSACEEMGFKTGNIICMQGPFDVDLNLAMLRACRARYLVTKESGSAGGFDEKIRAAKLAGATALVIGRPLEYSDKTYSLDEIIRLFAFNDRANKHVYLTGMGCGAGTLTNEAVSVINRCDCIIGSRRMVDDLACIDKVDGLKDKKVFVSYDPEEIEGYLRENQPGDVAILYSGDIGFYSGAALLKDRLYGYEVIAVPGISSAVYLCDKVMIPWQDVCFLSCHGRSPDLKNAIGMHDKVLILLGREGDAGRICTDLEVLGYGDLKVYIGQDLGSIGEKITSGRVSELKDIVSSSLSLMLIIKE